MIVVFMFLTMLHVVRATSCTCEAGVYYGDGNCLSSEEAKCGVTGSAYENGCVCLPKCVFDDGYCNAYNAFYDSATNRIYSCDESTVNSPKDCCPVDYTDTGCKEYLCTNKISSPANDCVPGQTKPFPACSAVSSFATGTVSCNTDCTYNTVGCVQSCNNGLLEPGEICDVKTAATADFGGKTCRTQTSGNLNSGKLTCGSDCTTIGTSLCVPECGNGYVESVANEQCDDGYAGNVNPCTYENEYGELVSTLYGSKGACDYCDSSCKNVIGQYCGDGIPQYGEGEECDSGTSNGVICSTAPGTKCTYCGTNCKPLQNFNRCTADSDCSGTSYCNSGYCIDACDFYAVFSNNCNANGCRFGDTLDIRIHYRGNCAATTAIQVDMSSYISEYGNEYDGFEYNIDTNYCNIQKDAPPGSMPGITKTSPILENTKNYKEILLQHTFPTGFGGSPSCVGSNLNYYNIGFKGVESYTGLLQLPSTSVVKLVNPYCGDKNIDTWIGEECDKLALVPDAKSKCVEEGKYEGTVTCDANCKLDYSTCGTLCGNGYPESGEDCDKGTANSDTCTPAYGQSCDYCTTTTSSVGCRVGVVAKKEYCGDNIIQTAYYEQCDNGTILNGKTCTAAYNSNCPYCTSSCEKDDFFYGCGDGIPQYDEGEECDDGADGNSPTGKCNSACKKNFCGDGIIQKPNFNGVNELCDNGTALNGQVCVAEYGKTCSYCTSACSETVLTGSRCGDNIIDPSSVTKGAPELCDGNSLGSNMCSMFAAYKDGPKFNYGTVSCSYCELDASTCSICRDGITNTLAGEQCDDNNDVNDDGCTNGCMKTRCGDGTVQKPNTQGFNEECDDGNDNNEDSCTTDCRTAVCGDGYIQNGVEVCDPLRTSYVDDDGYTVQVYPIFSTQPSGDCNSNPDFEGKPFSCSEKICVPAGYHKGNPTCINGCTKINTASCSCNNGLINCNTGACININNDVSNCGECGKPCENYNCGLFKDVTATCDRGECTTCDITCTNDNQCDSGAYCTGNSDSPGTCIDDCEYNATISGKDCSAQALLGGCRPTDILVANISYRGGQCSLVTGIQVDLFAKDLHVPLYEGYTGDTYCNIQKNPELASMTDFRFDGSLANTTTTKNRDFEYVLPEDFDKGTFVCNNKNLSRFEVGLEGPLPESLKYIGGNAIDVKLVVTCGDDICMDALDENAQTCFRDCFKDGWNTTNNRGWSLLPGNVLHANRGGISVVSTYAVDIKADVNYILSYNLFKDTSCIMLFDYNDGNCTSYDGLTQKKCFNKQVELSAGAVGTGYGETIISVPKNNNATNEKYFKDVKLRLSTGTGCIGVSIANLSLKESTHDNPDNIKYNYSLLTTAMPPGNMSSTGCCPNNYCWDGKVCQDSWQWMANATLPGIWNSLNISNWTDRHLNSANISEAVSYRCIVDNDNGVANWIPSKIKYDWDYKTSGFCARETDCFVSESFSMPLPYSKGCIHHGDVVSDAPYTFGQGNHYCYRGNWTTKSYIVATFLQNISETMPYSLQCYNDTHITYNLDDRTTAHINPILSSCVVIQKESASKENVITGIVFRDTSKVEAFLTYLTEEYEHMYAVNIDEDLKIACLSGGEKVTDSNFSKCIEKSGTSDIGGLFVYYETNYNYIILSDSAIDGLTRQTVWNAISGFFKGLFTSPTITTPFTAINYTTNYDKIYVLRNNTVNVTALEEAKYDEAEKGITTIMYVRYSGTLNTTNPIYEEVIYKTVNNTMVAQGKTKIKVNVSVSNTTNPIIEQELIIKSQEPSGLWKYFTSVLRTR